MTTYTELLEEYCRQRNLDHLRRLLENPIVLPTVAIDGLKEKKEECQ